MSIQNFLLKKYLRHFYKPRLNESVTLEQARAELDQVIERYMPLSSSRLEIWKQTLGDIDCENLAPKDKSTDGALFYIHGGMFSMGSPLSHRGATMVMAERLGMRVVVPDYRLAPEHPYPAALDDVHGAYLALLEEVGDTPVYLAGDQSGACLAFQLVHSLIATPNALPKVLIGISGLYDLALESPSLTLNADSDCFATREVFTRGLGYYLGDRCDRATPELSPLYEEIEGFPPTLLQVSSSEMLLDDSRRMAEKLLEGQVESQLSVYTDVPHCWHLGAVALPEGKQAISDIGCFINKHADGMTSAALSISTQTA